MITNQIKNLLLLLLIVVGSLPSQMLLTTFSESNSSSNTNVTPLMGDSKYTHIPRLTSVNSEETGISGDTFDKDLFSNQTQPNFAIGSQEGVGEGSYQVYENATLIDAQELQVKDQHKTTNPEEHENSITIDNISDFDTEGGNLNFASVTALNDWRLIENDTNSPSSRSSLSNPEVAQEFNVTEDYLNISAIRVYFELYDEDIDGRAPLAELKIMGDNGDEPDTGSLYKTINLTDNSIYLSLWSINEDGYDWPGGWLEYSISPQIRLNKGKYWFVLDDTDTVAAGHAVWKRASDTSGNPNNGDYLYKYDDSDSKIDSGGWSRTPTVDLIMLIEVLAVDGSYDAVVYNDPRKINFNYTTTAGVTELTSFTDIALKDASDNLHTFTTNTSVVFNVSWILNISYELNPILATSSYHMTNSTFVNWNLTFSTAAIVTTFKIRNHTIKITGVELDWNGTEIYWNNSISAEYSDLDNDVNITLDGNPANKYTNGSSVLYVNASTLAENTTWHVWFEAPNYIYDINLSQEGASLDLPFTTYTMNDYDLNFEVEEAGNLTYWIDYPNGSQLLRKNINDSSSSITDLWDIDGTFDNIKDVNGTYYLQAFWNNSDSTKVGTYIREVDMIVNTSFDYQYEAEVILGTYLNITVYYDSTHNTTGINNANVSGVPSWGDNNLVAFNHTTAHGPYTFSLEINSSQNNPGDFISVDVSAQLPGYVSNSTTIDVRVVAEATLTPDIPQDFVLEWRQNRTIEIKYNQTGGNGINESTITVTGDSTNAYNISNVYYYRFNSTQYSGVGTYLNLNITASQVNYSTKVWYFNLTITSGGTNILGSVDGNIVTNYTQGITQIYANSSVDSIIFSTRYYHELTGNTINTTTPTIASDLTSYIIDEETNLNWTLTIDPDKTGIFLINISFNFPNFNDSTFIFNVTIINAPTSIYSELSDPTNVYYGEYHYFFLLYNNTEYNENITGLTDISGIIIDNDTKVEWLNRTGNFYWFRFDFTQTMQVGSHSVNVTFEEQFFDSASIILNFEILIRPTGISVTDYESGVIKVNGSSFIRHYSPSEYDNFSIWLRYYDNRTDTTLDIPSIDTYIDGSIIATPSKDGGSYNWSIVFDGSVLGSYSCNITFSLFNYQTHTFTVIYIIQAADTTITDKNIDPIPAQTNVISGNTFDFWLVWQSEYGEVLNDSQIEGNGTSTDIVLISSNSVTGNHTFSLTAPDIGIYVYNLTFIISNYTKTEFLVKFNITERHINLDVSLSTNNTASTIDTLQYGEIHYFNIYLNDSQTGQPMNAAYASPLPTNITFDTVVGGNHSFLYNAFEVGTFSSLEIIFMIQNYANYTYTITFIVDKRSFLIDDVLSHPANGSTPIQVKIGNVKNFSVFLRDYRTGDPLNISVSNIMLSENITFISLISSGNHSFEYAANQLGLFLSLTVNFSIANYYNISFFISFNVYNRFMYINGTLSSPDTGSTIDTLQYGELYYFTVFLMDNETDTPVNASINSIDFGIVFVGVLNSGNHSFYYNATQVGDFLNLNIVFSLINYNEITYSISWEVSLREMILDQSLSSYGLPPVTIDYLQYGDLFYFYIFFNDSRTNNILNISIYNSLPFNVYFENFSLTKGHLFIFHALEIGTYSRQIEFNISNYIIYSYQLIFTIVKAQSNLLTPTSLETTHYTKDINFSIIWESIPNTEPNVTSPVLRISSLDISTSETWVIFKEESNGNYTFTILADYVRTVTVTLDFQSPFFVAFSHDVQITILPVPTQFGSGTSPDTTTIIGETSPFYFSDNYAIRIDWEDTFNNSGIEDPSPILEGNGSDYIILITTFVNGAHDFLFNATKTGIFEIQITLGTTNYQNLTYSIIFNISEMPTLPLFAENIDITESIYVEEAFTISGTGYQTFREDNISKITQFEVWMNNSIVSSNLIQVTNDSYSFEILISTLDYKYGFYNISLLVNSTGYQSQLVNLTIILLGRELAVDIILPGQRIEQGEDIEIRVTIDYMAIDVGIGATTLLAPLSSINVHYYIEIEFRNGTSSIIEADMETDVLGHATYIVEGSTTKNAVGFNNITVLIAGSMSSLPTSYSMSADELNLFEITQFLNPLDILIPALIILLIILLIVTSVYYVNRKRVKRSDVKKFADLTVEKGFEDIKSIRLIIARHQSGLQFYAEKTIAELQADTDALSGMSAAMSSFLEELSESMTSPIDSDEIKARDKIEVMSREGLHMLVWHGNYSSLIIISESRLPDYFQSRLKILGHELEGKFINELKDFYSSDQVPSTVVKKMVRKYIPLHYFCAFVLNEGVLTLDSIKLNRKESKMLKSIKNIMFKIEGVNYFFSEQIISHLSQEYKRSEAIKFLDRAIQINLLIEAEQDDLLRISRR